MFIDTPQVASLDGAIPAFRRRDRHQLDEGGEGIGAADPSLPSGDAFLRQVELAASEDALEAGQEAVEDTGLSRLCCVGIRSTPTPAAR